MNRRERAERLVAKLVADGFVFTPEPTDGLWVEPEPGLGTKADLLQLRSEVRQYVRRGDRTARNLIEAVRAEGVELSVTEGELELHWPDGPEDLNASRPRSLLRLLAEHEPAVVNRLRLNTRHTADVRS